MSARISPRRQHILDHRDCRPELMDDPALPAAEHQAALAALARINRLSAVARSLWPLLEAEAPARVLELGSGSGDIALALARRAARSGVELELCGSDLSERAVARAKAAAGRSGLPVEFIRLDALAMALPEHDVLICTLLLHHFDEDDASRLLTTMGRAARKLVIVSDLDRSLPGLALAWLGTRLLSRSRVAQIDGSRSVRAAFRPGEALQLARDAGLPSPRVARVWPCRWLLTSRT
jgi:2-polyprenyl-3-methyl-5-hydroxy-6-metoxy-1,4-benzoquinol methylase